MQSAKKLQPRVTKYDSFALQAQKTRKCRFHFKTLQAKKTVQMFTFRVNTFKKANENSSYNSDNSENNKKQKANARFAFDDELFYQFELDNNNDKEGEETDLDEA